MSLTSDERHFYNRQLKLPQFGEAAQLKLKKARVLCIGAGGLGAPLLRYLAGAGVGHIGIVDFDTVDVSNVHRQILYNFNEAGQNKAELAARKLREANPYIEVVAYPALFDYQSGLALAKDYDLLIDGTDNFAPRYAVNQIAIELNKPALFAAVQEFYGQVGLFQPQTHPCFRCVFPEPPPPELAANCAENGILGTVPGIMGLMQAHLAILYLSGLYEGAFDEMMMFDLLSFSLQKFKLRKNADCPACSAKRNPKAIEEFFMSLSQNVCGDEAGTISPAALATLLKETQQDYVLIDVRNPDEHARENIGGQLIPLPTLHSHLSALPKTGKIIVYCQKGIRSKSAADVLREAGFKDVLHLAGGMDAWLKEHA